MEKFTTITSPAVPLTTENIDTDQIIPARFLKATTRDGFGDNVFRDWRFDKEGKKNTSFPLEDPKYSGCILVAGKNFGCGSSREHAAWAIHDYGFKVVICSVFADIFKNNALNNGLLVFELDEKIIKKIFKKISLDSNLEFTIDLIEQKFYSDDGSIEEGFEINEYNKTCLLNGFDNIDYLLSIKDKILKYENDTGR